MNDETKLDIIIMNIINAKENFIPLWDFIFKTFWIFVIILGIILTIKKAENVEGRINIANRSQAPPILAIDTNNIKNNEIINNLKMVFGIFLKENIPININGHINGNKKYVSITLVTKSNIDSVIENPTIPIRYFFGKSYLKSPKIPPKTKTSPLKGIIGMVEKLL